MEFSVKTTNVSKINSQCLVVGVLQSSKPKLTESGMTLDKSTNKQLTGILSHGDIKGNNGETLLLHTPQGIAARRILLLGLGKKAEISHRSLRLAVKSATKALSKMKISSADFSILDAISSDKNVTRQVRNIVEAANETLYQYDETKSGRSKSIKLKKAGLIVARARLSASRVGVVQGTAIANGVNLAKKLSDLPGNICTPGYLARQAKNMAKTRKIKTSVLSEADMKRLKMGSLLSVSRGSREPAKLIIMEYKGGNPGTQPVVLVGKGLTFDAGGISIKPAAAMDEMKYDMCGGASVFGAMQAVAEMQLNLNVVGIVPSSENLPDGAANKPGDIVTSMSGTTIEILNTDAEGRLILCDALTYAKRFKPAAVVDIATLTGACIIALGHHASGLFSNNNKLASELLSAADASGDRAWQLPMWDDYSKQLHSNFADLANIGGRSAGSVTAACFLSHFTEDYDWAHLDVAGTAWKSAGPKGATGRPVPLLVEFLLGRC